MLVGRVASSWGGEETIIPQPEPIRGTMRCLGRKKTERACKFQFQVATRPRNGGRDSPLLFAIGLGTHLDATATETVTREQGCSVGQRGGLWFRVEG